MLKLGRPLLEMAGFLCSCLLIVSAVGKAGSAWVPYSAHFKTTTSNAFAGGNQNTITTVGIERRSADGSTASFEMVNGLIVSGELRLACGQLVRLNYSAKQATISKIDAPQHSRIPPDAPLGTKSIAGIQATGYPVHADGGGGAVYIDENNDIPLKMELHTDKDGHRLDFVRELDSVDLNVQSADSSMKIPAGFSVVPSGAATGTCGSSH